MKITVWLKERELNARRFASGKTGEDRAGWLEDADHFQAALAAVEERDSLRKDAERWDWVVRHASLGFNAATSWDAVIRLPLLDGEDQTITALVDRARSVAGD